MATTDNLPALAYKAEILQAAQEHGLPPHVLAGLVHAESSGDTWAVRAEPRFRWLLGDEPGEPQLKPVISTEDTEWACQRISWGLCQVMGATARGLGLAREWLTRLLEPAVGLDYGARYLSRCMARAGSLEAGLLRYNGGADSTYPRRVLALAERYREAFLP